MIYLDHAATTPLRPEAAVAMAQCRERCWGNPSGLHSLARQARARLEQARERVQAALGFPEHLVIFTAGASEANRLALRALAGRQGHVVASAIEHPSLLTALRERPHQLVGVDTQGRVEPDAVVAALRPETRLVSVMVANNEVGSLQPIESLSRLLGERSVALHCDAVQAAGMVELPPQVDALSLSAHKFGGPVGVGCLLIRRSCLGELPEGLQEYGLRPGTENLPGVVGMLTALELALAEQTAESTRLTGLRDSLTRALLSAVPGLYITGPEQERLPQIASFAIERVGGEALVVWLDELGVAASTGSACSTGSRQPSHVLTAMGLERNLVRGSLRLSLGRTTTVQDIEGAVAAVVEAVTRLRALAPA